jgi:hypothetical protein
MTRRIKRKALNRGTAMYLGDNRVRFIWACGCCKVERMTNPGGAAMHSGSVSIFVRNWRLNGVVLEQCPKHPDHYEKLSPLERLNRENPQL